MIRIYNTKDYDEMSKIAAELLAAQILMKPNSVLGLATGSSPLGIYAALIKKYKEGLLDFSEITAVNLDEYKGITPDNEQSYAYFMNENLFRHVNIRDDRHFIPNGQSTDAKKVCEEYDSILRKVGTVDLQLLGIGHDGHIGFNEPSDEFPLHTHCIKLEDSTIKANQRFFSSIEEVPTEAYTMGVGQIMQAKTILMIVSGKEKAGILKEALKGKVTPKVPASILQLHPDVRVVADADALSEYYA